MWRQANVIAVHQHSVGVREFCRFRGSDSNGGLSRRSSGRAAIPASALRAGVFFMPRIAYARFGQSRRPYLTIWRGPARVVAATSFAGPLFSRHAQTRELFLLPKSVAANEGPRRMVVFRGFRRRLEERLLRRGCNGHLHGIQQTVVFKFAHRGLVRELWPFRPFCTHRNSPNTTDASFRVMNESF